jgi:alkane 1-monooxygenase
MAPILYLIPMILPALGLVGLWFGGAALCLLPLTVFGLLPFMEVFVTGRGAEIDHAGGAHKRMHDAMLVAAFVMVWAVWAMMIYQLSVGQSGLWERIGMMCCGGIVFGGLGINVAHELGHRPQKPMQFLSQVLLLPSLYTHFFIEHNRGHHRRMATPEDPATARLGETLYAFWVRSSVGGWLSAWQIEGRRLRSKGLVAHCKGNLMLHLQLFQVLCIAMMWMVFGLGVTAFWLGSAILGFLMLETVNYVEHYGLVREKLSNGKYERVTKAHSWTSDHPLSRALLFELPRHADHHAHAGRPYASLRHFSSAPQLPTGYAGMILLALVPPVFVSVMDRQISTEAQRVAS